MDGVLAYMSKPSKSGKRKYAYQNYKTHEYSFDKVPGVEYEETKLVYNLIDSLKRREELFKTFKVLKPTWKRI